LRVYRWSTIMKNPLHYIHTYTLRTKQILGISYDQFLLLVQQAELINQKQLVEVEQNKVRINALLWRA
jgi:hypothetical protein